MKRPVLLLALVLSASAAGEDSPFAFSELLLEPVDESRSRAVPLKVYLPDTELSRPVIVLSHGLGGSREASPYLGRHWAEAGYVAVFVQHSGSDVGVWEGAAPGERTKALKQAASLRSTLDRLGDIPFVLDTLEKWNVEEGHDLLGKLDLDRVGMAGHSFGAVTTQAMMGQKFAGNRSRAEPRFDAFFPMSPSPGRRIGSPAAFGHVEAPVLCMTGTKDGSPLDPDMDPASRREVYASLPAGDGYELVFHGADHFAFSDRKLRAGERRDDRIHPAIRKISLRFWDAYLRDDPEARRWLKSKKPVEEGTLAEEDVWQWK